MNIKLVFQRYMLLLFQVELHSDASHICYSLQAYLRAPLSICHLSVEDAPQFLHVAQVFDWIMAFKVILIFAASSNHQDLFLCFPIGLFAPSRAYYHDTKALGWVCRGVVHSLRFLLSLVSLELGLISILKAKPSLFRIQYPSYPIWGVASVFSCPQERYFWLRPGGGKHFRSPCVLYVLQRRPCGIQDLRV